ncbi:nucleoside 2-deoxyribosyltransferase [Nicoliella spurrieriana]|uniref:Nucleoside 2-deoxyribosyltransferase n=1 Tax=Nicoliella spurrieriana TaxID=2925830 RepID=A0A976X4Z2_9LACO|nr:nucleoside 2-deoxyribosyltransferase [Nicoliella spurrieriana]UQS86488.1 nucleoside 2-deoxyribosyltransferase [Nicoliella spurrieriana]
MKKVYLAGPFFDDDQIARISRAEEALFNNPTISDFFSPRKVNFPEEKEGTVSWGKKVYQKDIDELEASDVIVAVLDFKDGFVDSGTAFEIGYATNIGKPIVILHENNGIINLMISNSIVAYFKDANDILQYDFDKLKTIPYEGPLI